MSGAPTDRAERTEDERTAGSEYSFLILFVRLVPIFESSVREDRVSAAD